MFNSVTNLNQPFGLDFYDSRYTTDTSQFIVLAIEKILRYLNLIPDGVKKYIPISRTLLWRISFL
jgi:hypothetical protein